MGALIKSGVDFQAVQTEFGAMFNSGIYSVDRVHGMDEIYVSAPTYKVSSDKVFYQEHIDGP